MKKILQNFDIQLLRRNLKFQIFFILVVVIFFMKMIFQSGQSSVILILQDFLVISAAASLILYLIELTHTRKLNPLSLVMNVGIISAMFFFLVNFSEPILNGIFNNIKEISTNTGVVFKVINFLYAVIILGAACYLFLVFRDFYFYKQKRSALYFTTMVVFFILASVTAGLQKVPDLDFIPTTFFIISILLIVINSIKISWIAFLSKKEKISLLVFSVLILVLFILNLVNNSGKEMHRELLESFSPALFQFLNLILIYGIVYFSILLFTTLFHLPTAEVYDKKAREISSLQYFSSLINQVLDYSVLEETITDLALKVAGADSSWIVWHKQEDIKTSAHKNIGFVDARLITEHIIKKTAGERITGTKLFSLDKLASQKDFSRKYSSAAVSALRTINGSEGFLFVTMNENRNFDEEDVSAITTFAEYSSIAVENCSLLSENIEKERLQKEFDLARDIQKKILPLVNPDLPGLSISSVFIPAFEVGGDYYDFFRFPDNRIGFVIADVSGKGITAAFIMAEIKGIFESLSRILTSPREILIKANDILKNTLDRRSFVSAAYGIIDFKTEKLVIARAGHCPVLLLRENNALHLRPAGLGLGLNYSEYFSDTLQETEMYLKENDIIVLYTDGITEAKNSEMEDFGSKRFEKILLENLNDKADVIAGRVISEVSSHSENIPQHDDITLVILKWKQKNQSDGDKEWQNSAQQLKIKVM